MAEKERGPILTAVALFLSVLAVLADIVALLSADMNVISRRVTDSVAFVLGTNAAHYVEALPKVQLYSELWPMYLVFSTLLATITYYEYRERIIPDAVTVPGMFMGVGFAAGFHHISVADSSLSAVAGMGVLLLLREINARRGAGDSLGLGAVKMVGLLGAFMGHRALERAVLIASLVGIVYGLARFRSTREPIEFGPWLAMGGLVGILFA